MMTREIAVLLTSLLSAGAFAPPALAQSEQFIPLHTR